MRTGALHWALAAGVALAVHLAVFMAGDAEQWRAAEQSARAPEAVWGVSEIALTEEVDPLRTATPAEPVEDAERPAPRETRALRAEAPAERAQVALPETAEPAGEKKEEKPVDRKAEQKPVAERRVQEPVEEPEETQLKEKPKKKPEKKNTKKESASGGPAGRAAGGDARRSSGSGRASFSNYAGRVAAHLRRHKRYPSSAGRANGTARVSFSLSRNGALGGVRLVASSGNAALDRAAISMVRRASPFPAMPPGLNRRSASFTVPIRFAR